MKLSFLLVGSALATEWPTESCVAKSSVSTSECFDLIGDKDGCNSRTISNWGNVCEYNENISLEFTDVANGRWLSDYFCITWESHMKIYSYALFASKQTAMDVCAAACDKSETCRYAMFDWDDAGYSRGSCAITTDDCTGQGVYLANSMEGNHSLFTVRYSVYEKTKPTIPSAGQFTIAFRSSEDACYIDADGCMTDGEGNYDNNEMCWFYYTGPGTLTFEEFSLEVHPIYPDAFPYYEDIFRTDNLDDYYRLTGTDSLSGLSVEVTDTQSFGYTSNFEKTWPGFKVCPVNSDLIETKNELQSVCNESVDNCKACGGRDAVKNGVSYCKLKRRFAKKCKPLKDPICGRVRGCELKTKTKNKGKGKSKTVSKCKGKPQLD